ncbi:MAG: hypothetical protein M1814_000445 [Vezdaea aestivalis]|nr:MAG: hypothetical protein M1814_000445 [Vezdaea aestivalis]
MHITPSTLRRWLAISALALSTSSPLYPRFPSTTSPGLSIDSACPADTKAAIQAALPLVQSLATAGLAAATYPSSTPFNRFFSPSTSQTVQLTLSKVQSTLSGRGSSVAVICSDPLRRCVPENATAHSANAKGSLAYTHQDPTAPYINVCNFYLKVFKPTPNPCASNARGSISLAETLLHEMTHLPSMNIDGGAIEDLAYGEPAVEKLNNETNAAAALTTGPIRNADSYMFMSKFAWLGLWGDGRPGTECRGNYADLQQFPITLSGSGNTTYSGGGRPPSRSTVDLPYANGQFGRRA